jgi:hypothetical protein
VYLRVTEKETSLEEAEDLKRFHVEVASGVSDLSAGLAGWGRVDGDHVWVNVESLRRAAAGRVGARWDADFAGMVDYARVKGWVSEDGAAIRAHIEPDSSATS